MKAHTNAFKEQIKTMGRELDSKITYSLNGVNVELGKEQLNSITPTYQGALLKSVMKELDIDSNVYIPEKTILNYQFGVKVNGEYEYINFGNYIVYKAEKQEDTNSYKLTCYDKMLYSMVDYEKMNISYPISIRDYIKAICDKLGLTFANASDNFANYDKQIQNELYLDEDGNSLGYTFRDVLDELSQVTASCICINNNDKLEIRYINDTNDTIDEEFLKDVNVKFGEKFGAVNTIVLSRSADSDNVYYPETLPENPYEFKISDNQIMNFNDRSDYLPDIYEKLNGLEFYINDFSSTGICYYELLDRYNVKIGDNTYSCVMLNDEINISQGLEENVFTEMPEETQTDYTKADKTDRKVNQTYIIANKQKGEIELVTSEINSVKNDLSNKYYDIEQTNTLIQNSTDGLMNTLSQVGGNNLLRNTFFYEYENGLLTYWSGVQKVVDKYESKSRNALSLQNGTIKQSVNLTNKKYCCSFKYIKLSEVANAKFIINGKEYVLDTNIGYEKHFEIVEDLKTDSITIEFVCDTNDGFLVYEVMLNEGENASLFTQNTSESISDTVNIGKGVEVLASNIKNKTRMDADGLRGINTETNELTFYQTTDGIYGKEVETESMRSGNLIVTTRNGHNFMSGL